jgi:uncharacterized integral membrane protein
MERRSRTPTFLHTFNIARILDHDVVGANMKIKLTMRIVRVLIIVIIIVVANQTRVGLDGVGAEIYR